MSAEIERVPLQGLTPEALGRLVPCGEPGELRKLISQVLRGGRVTELPPRGVRRTTWDFARPRISLPSLELRARVESAIDPFVKYVLAGRDGRPFETVRIPLERQGRYSVCTSSQVGCALACRFCATGRLGLLRNLEAWEIVEQVRCVRAELPRGSRVSGVVFQGMGEPLANADAVFAAIRALSEPSGLAINMRAITVCTSGLPGGIVRLGRELPKVRLGVSIGSARPGARAALMPIDQRHPLDDVLAAVGEHVVLTGLQPMWAYTLLAGVNDSDEDADALVQRALAFRTRHGVAPRVSLIPYNSIGAEDPFERAAAERAEAFRQRLWGQGVFAIRRYSGGSDVAAACGQLAASP